MIPPRLDELLRAIGPAGFEEEVAAIVRRQASAFAEVSGDVLGTTTATVGGTPGGPLLAVFAHCDEVGAMVSHVDGDGLLSLHKLGDLAPATLVDQRVDVRSRNGHVPDVGRPERRRGRGGHGRGSGTRGAGRSSRGVRPRARTRPGPHSLGSRA